MELADGTKVGRGDKEWQYWKFAWRQSFHVDCLTTSVLDVAAKLYRSFVECYKGLEGWIRKWVIATVPGVHSSPSSLWQIICTTPTSELPTSWPQQCGRLCHPTTHWDACCRSSPLEQSSWTSRHHKRIIRDIDHLYLCKADSHSNLCYIPDPTPSGKVQNASTCLKHEERHSNEQVCHFQFLSVEFEGHAHVDRSSTCPASINSFRAIWRLERSRATEPPALVTWMCCRRVFFWNHPCHKGACGSVQSSKHILVKAFWLRFIFAAFWNPLNTTL